MPASFYPPNNGFGNVFGKNFLASFPSYAAVTTPPSTGRKVWLKADAGITIVTGVSAWADQSGNGNNYAQATGANQPAFTASAINGLPAVTFNGTNSYMTGSFNMAGAKSVFAVRKLTTTPILNAFYCLYQIGYTSAHTGALLYYGNSASWSPTYVADDIISNIANASGVAQALDTSWHVDEHTYNGSGNTVQANYGFVRDASTQTVVSTGAQNDLASTLSSLGVDLGAANAPLGDYLNGSVAEFLVYDHVLTAPELTQIRAYFLGRYGIA